jgi:hypothetical protein
MYRIHDVSALVQEVSSVQPGSMRFLRPLLRLVSGAKATGAVLRLTGVLRCCRRHGWCKAVRIAVRLNAAIVPFSF